MWWDFPPLSNAPWTAAIIFQPRTLLLANRFGVRGTLKSRWREQNQLLREITGSFRSEK
jgi:hypothetical protein